METIPAINLDMKPVNITQILNDRGDKYGEFKTHALLTQSLKQAFYTNAINSKKLTPSMCEAIEMIFHKLGRIGNGDPTYLDSWVDIVGYTQLVIDELEKENEVPF